ncbi:MAG: hypothetical protein WCS52_02585 [bacterium]
MLRIIFTLDYEIHGNGEGCPHALMVEPTNRMMDLFDKYGAKLTIMADVAEILKFSEYKAQTGRDDYFYDAIVAQLQDAIRRGHDVQLHLHPSYFNARQDGERWIQDWSEYNVANLPPDRINEILSLGKHTLEKILNPVMTDYACIAFRAANWSMSPSTNVVQALINNGFKIDTSVFKHGQREGAVSFDYSAAPSELVPWRIDKNDICARSEDGQVFEFPIYSENRWLGAFLTKLRIYRTFVSSMHKISSSDGRGQPKGLTPPQSKSMGQGLLQWVRRKHAWKADFNQCTGQQLIGALNRASRNHDRGNYGVLPFVLIGHSKLFIRLNQWSVKSFLDYAARDPIRFQFGRLTDTFLPPPLTATPHSIQTCME